MKSTTLREILENLTQEDWNKMHKHASLKFKQSPVDAEDHVQNMIETLWTKVIGMKKYNDKQIDKAEAFLVKCLDNKVIDHLRKKQIPIVHNYEHEWFPEMDVNLSRIDYRKWIVDKLDGLDTISAEVFILYNIHGMSFRDIIVEYPDVFSYPNQVKRVYDKTLSTLRRSARLEEIVRD